MIRRHVVRDEVEDEAQAATPQALAEARERLVAAEVLVDPVVPDGEAGAADVFLAQVRQDAVVLREPLGIRLRDASGRFASLPHAKQPDEVEPVRGQPVELDVWDVVERGCLPSAAASSESRTRVLTWKSAGYLLTSCASAFRPPAPSRACRPRTS